MEEDVFLDTPFDDTRSCKGMRSKEQKLIVQKMKWQVTRRGTVFSISGSSCFLSCSLIIEGAWQFSLYQPNLQTYRHVFIHSLTEKCFANVLALDKITAFWNMALCVVIGRYGVRTRSWKPRVIQDKFPLANFLGFVFFFLIWAKSDILLLFFMSHCPIRIIRDRNVATFWRHELPPRG
jgi:hypothetical protein